jgi:hypothetical protein
MLNPALHLSVRHRLKESCVRADPIYLLDFRHGQVVEIDSGTEARLEDAIDGSKASESPKSGITFAALGSPIERKD